MVALLASCSGGSDEMTEEVATPTQTFFFHCQGDWSQPKLKGTLMADGTSMTDLWVFDYVGSTLMQTVHQVSTDENFGTPEVSLTYGSHQLFFVASRGKVPVVDADACSIVWGKPSDTFWKEYDIDVDNTATSSRSVTLERVATKLRLAINDEVPVGTSQVVITPSVWYYGLNYATGTPLEVKSDAFTITVPASYIGTVGQLAVNLFSLSGTTEWTTDVTLQALDGSNNVLGAVTLNAVPLLGNRTTQYSGSLFTSPGATDVSLITDWLEPHTSTW